MFKLKENSYYILKTRKNWIIDWLKEENGIDVLLTWLLYLSSLINLMFKCKDKVQI